MLAAGIGDMAGGTLAAGDMALAVAMTICAIVEEVDVVLVAIPFMPGMLAISISAVFPFHSLEMAQSIQPLVLLFQKIVLQSSQGPKLGIM